MMQNGRAIALALAAALAAALGSCSKAERGGSGPARTGPREASAAPAAAPRQGESPAVGEELTIPAIRLGKDDFLVAYKHGHHAYLSTRGYDTEVFRFRLNLSGTIRQGSAAKLLQDGETLVDAFDFLHTNDTVALRSSFAAGGGSDCDIRPEGGALVARGKGFSVSYSAPEPGRLRIERRNGERIRVEEWSRSGSVLSDTMDAGAKGRFEGDWPRPRRYLERPEEDPSGASDLECSFFDLEGSVKFRADAVEPLGEGLVMNFAAAFPQGPSLEALAILELVLGEERRITPLLARLYLGPD